MEHSNEKQGNKERKTSWKNEHCGEELCMTHNKSKVKIKCESWAW